MATIEVVDTSDQDEVILVIPTAKLRAAGAIEDDMQRVIADLILGVPVAGCELDRWQMSALGLFTAEEMAARRAQPDLFSHVPN